MALECSICFDALGIPEEDDNDQDDDDEEDDEEGYGTRNPVLTRCGHMYHYECLRAWLSSTGNERTRSCPQCRERVYYRELTWMDFEGQNYATERAKRKSGRASPQKVVAAKSNEHSGNCQCFNKEEHEKLVKDYGALLEIARMKKDQLALIRGEIASLRAFVDQQESNDEEQFEQGTKRKHEDVDGEESRK